MSQESLGLAELRPVDEFDRLLALHESLRSEAQRAHGLRTTKLPAATSAKGRSLQARLRKAIEQLGAGECEKRLRWQAQRWAEDPGQLAAYSTDSVWSPGSLAAVAKFMAQPKRGSERQTTTPAKRDDGGAKWTVLREDEEVA